MNSLPNYIKVKDYYCINYIGDDSRIKRELLSIQPELEKQFGLKVYITFGDVPKGVYFTTLRKDSDLKKFLLESEITIPDFLEDRA